MDQASPFQILSLAEFDGLSLDEKLAYLDLQLTTLYGERWRERLANPEGAGNPGADEPRLH